jgi:hypothetical protein
MNPRRNKMNEWIQKAKSAIVKRKTKGVFAQAAKKAGMSTSAYAHKIKANPSKYTPLQKKRAGLALAFAKARRKK